MDDRVVGFKVSGLWKVMIVLVAVGLASLILFSVPPLPNSPSSSPPPLLTTLHRHQGGIWTFASDRMVYDNIVVSAFHGQDCLATAALTPFEHDGGELIAVWFRLWNVTLPQVVLNDTSFGDIAYVTTELRAEAMYGPGRQEIAMQVVCEDVKVVLVPSVNDTWHPTLRLDDEGPLRKCDVDGIWSRREPWLFAAVFVVPLLLFILALHCENFVFRPKL